jgi:hypothetical protein
MLKKSNKRLSPFSDSWYKTDLGCVIERNNRRCTDGHISFFLSGRIIPTTNDTSDITSFYVLKKVI